MSTFKHPSFNTEWQATDGQLIKGTINDGVINVARATTWVFNEIYNLEFKNLNTTQLDALIAIIVTKRGGVSMLIENLEGEDYVGVITSDITIQQTGFSKNCNLQRYDVSFSMEGDIV